MENESFIKRNSKMWVFFIFFILVMIFGIIIGFVYQGMQIQKRMGVSFDCNAYTSRQLGRNGCEANITSEQWNYTVTIRSNFDNLQIIQN